MNQKKNVLFILSDQHCYKALSHAGHPLVKTPNIDRLAKEGVRFTNAVTQNPICTPSRISWFSGQYCHNHGFYGLSGRNPDKLPSVVGHFKRHGYRTFAGGKVHLPENWLEKDTDVFFDPCGTSIGGDQEYKKYIKDNNLESKIDGNLYKNIKGSRRQPFDGHVSSLKYEDTHEGWTVRRAIDFMKDCKKDKEPFFAYVGFAKPHQLYTPTQPFWSMYKEDEIKLPTNANSELKGKSPAMKKMRNWWEKGDWVLFEPKDYESAMKRKLHGYLGNISLCDYAVGELMEYLDQNGLRENTIIIYSTDHGEFMCEHGMIEKSPGICADSVTRIPYIWSWKGKIKENYSCDKIVETIDFAPTISSLCGLSKMATSDGVDITPLLQGEDITPHEIGVTENPWSKSIYDGKYHYVYYPTTMFKDEYPDGFAELYDLDNDPLENNNLFFDTKYLEIITKFKDQLLSWLITTTRPITVHDVPAKKSEGSYTKYGHTYDADGKINPKYLKNANWDNYI